jgi:hypothetical protein
MNLHATLHLTSAHQINLFTYGEVALNERLKRRAIAHQDASASRTFV